MNKFSISGIVFLLFSISVFAQTPQPTVQPPIVNDDEVVKISTSLIQLDVVVTDKKGNHITDLKPEDIEIYENGKKQDISNFSYIFANAGNQPIVSLNPEGKNTPLIPPVKLKPEQIRRTFALVVDDLGLSFESIPTVKDTLKKFVNEQMEVGDLVAIIRTSGGIGALQSFTSDKRQLFAAIEKIQYNFISREPSTFDFDKSDISNQSSAQINPEPERQSVEIRNEYLAIGTLGALSYVVRGMKELPGRKAVMLFSEGFEVFREENGNIVPVNIFPALRSFADLANRAAVTIYPLDPRGLVNPGYSGADRSGANSNFNSISGSQTTLSYLANETGGIAYINQNNLRYGLTKALEDQGGYYLIGYQPDSNTFDPKKIRFNTFSVKIKREGLNVRYRSGFFGITDKSVAENDQIPAQKIYSALTSPFTKNEITLSLNTVLGDDPKSGQFIRSLIYVNGKELVFIKEPDGKRKAKFDIVAMTFGENGVPIDQFAKTYTVQVNEKTYQQILATGFIYNIPVLIKKPGAYQYRIALRDTNSEKVGSASQFIEVPNLKKKNLTLSGILLNNYTLVEWQKISQGEVQTTANGNNEQTAIDINTALRRYKRGTVLLYGYLIYNAKTPSPQIEVQTRLFYDRTIVLEGTELLDKNGQADLKRIQDANSIKLGDDLKLGSYILQIIVKDKLANKSVSQWIDFEIVE